MIQLLQGIERHPAKERFHSLLSLAGVEGALADRLKGTPAEKNLRAEWGEMDGVSGMVGTVTTSEGERLALAIFTNGVGQSTAAQRFIDRVAVALASYPQLPHPGECQRVKRILFPVGLIHYWRITQVRGSARGCDGLFS